LGVAHFPGLPVRLSGFAKLHRNGVAVRKLPNDLFRREMHAWWEADDMGGQNLTFIWGSAKGTRGG
jgi:hypothetical protein